MYSWHFWWVRVRIRKPDLWEGAAMQVHVYTSHNTIDLGYIMINPLCICMSVWCPTSKWRYQWLRWDTAKIIIRMFFAKMLHWKVMMLFVYCEVLWRSSSQLDFSMTERSKVHWEPKDRLNATWNMSQCKVVSYISFSSYILILCYLPRNHLNSTFNFLHICTR